MGVSKNAKKKKIKGTTKVEKSDNDRKLEQPYMKRVPVKVKSRDTMGFLHQFRLLLWKNITLKKRSPFVLLFEITIPLVLFVILLLIRKKQPAVPVGTRNHYANPLPSAGVVPTMQLFCDGGGMTDKDGFLSSPEHTNTTDFLRKLQSVAKHHHFFSPSYSPDEMDRLPQIYKTLIEDPVIVQNTVRNMDFQLKSVIKDDSTFVEFFRTKLNIPEEETWALLNASINLAEIYKMIMENNSTFNIPNIPLHLFKKSDPDIDPLTTMPYTDDEPSSDHVVHKRQIPDSFQDFVDKFVLSPKSNENIHDSISGIFNEYHPILKTLTLGSMFRLEDLLANDRVQRGPVLKLLLGLMTNKNFTAEELAQMAKTYVLSPTVLRQISCMDNFLLIFNFSKENDDADKALLADLQKRLCNLSNQQFLMLSYMLQSQIDDEYIKQRILTVLKINDDFQKLIIEMDKFYQFQESLYEMSVLATHLPQDACNPNFTVEDDGMGNYTHWTSNITMTTESPVNPDAEDQDAENLHPAQAIKKHKKKNKFAGILYLWNVMQKTFCGKPTLVKEKTIKHTEAEDDISNINLRDLGITPSQQDSLKIIVHILYSNPKVLYAPNDTAADVVIHKANATFMLIDMVSHYAKKWLNVSVQLREYLNENQTEYNLQVIKIMHQAMAKNKAVQVARKYFPSLDKFLNLDIPDTSFFLREIDLIDNTACSWLSLLEDINLNVFQGFKSEDDLVRYFLNQAYGDNVTTVAGVVFENIEKGKELPAHVKYKIRQNATFTPTTKSVRDRSWTPGPGTWSHPYYEFGFVWIQDIIERAVIDVQTGKDVIEPGSFVMQFPTSCYLYDEFAFIIEHIMPLCLTCSWVYSVSMLVQSIVYEKEQRLKEVMRMMGLNNAVHWCGWFIITFIQFSISMGILTLMLHYGHVLTYSDPWIVFVVLEIFAMATISFSFLVSTFYSKAKVAAACAGIVYFLTYVPYMYVAIREDVAQDKIPAVIKSVVSLFSTTAFGLCGKYFAFYEEEGVGVQWDNINLSPVEDDEYTLLMSVMMMLMDTFLYTLLAWYIENVFPGSYGLPKPWYFPFTKTYWFAGTTKPHDIDCGSIWDLCRNGGGYSLLDNPSGQENRGADYYSKFEAEPTHLTRGVEIDNLTKVYKTGKKTAVNNLSLNFYESQITSFLGHNGAGKTTTMSILTGLFPSTSGYALIYDHDIRSDMDVIRQSLGMCPQHNVLFEKLTVEEHLWFYARLKGMKTEDLKPEMETMLEDIGLPHKRDSRIDCLSGGMQRKLSVAIAFVGGSRTVILDEPTAGVDPYARRAIWDLLVKYKLGRTIILSTHHMDEADILGDRIAIISNGELKCCGSSVFLKNTFGEGYYLSLVKKHAEEDLLSIEFDTESLGEDMDKEAIPSKCKESEVSEFVKKYVSTAYLKFETNRELEYILPFEEAKKSNFEKLFDALDTSLESLHISSYGVKDTNLEEVFLKVTEAAIQEEAAKKEKSNSSSNGTAVSVPNSPNGNGNSGHEVELGSLGSGNLTRTDSNDSLLISTEESSDGSSNENAADELLIPVNGHVEDLHFKNCADHLQGRGSHKLSKKVLKLNQFRGVIAKRFHYVVRNWKGLFSQIILPAIFVSIAMTVALSAPTAKDLPPLELSPTQYFNQTQPKGNFIPFLNENPHANLTNSTDAGPNALMDTFKLASGVGATCVLKSKFNSSFDIVSRSMNYSHKDIMLLKKYYGSDCDKVFVSGIHIQSYIPPTQVIPKGQLYGPGLHNDTSPIPTNSPDKKFYPTCHCAKDSKGFVCADSDTYSRPPEFKVVTRDIMQNLTGEFNTQDFLLYTQDAEYRLHRYGAFSFGLEQAFVPEDYGSSAPPIFKKIAVRRAAKAWYNHKGYHAMPVFLNALNNAILRANLPASKGNKAAYGITLINHPLNQTNNMLNKDLILQGSDVLIAIFIIAAMSFVPASFVVFLVYERSTKAKHLQFVSGIDPVMYWLANYVWDMCNYIIPAFCIVIILLLFQIPAYASTQNLPAVVSLFLLYGWSITPIMYPASFWFKEPSSAYIFLIVINLFTGITCIVSSFLLEVFSYDAELRRIHKVVKDVFLLMPNYCLGRGLMDIAFNEYKNEFFFKTGQYDRMRNPFEWELTVRNLVSMSIMGIVFFGITVLCEFRFFIGRLKTKVRRNRSDLLMSAINDEDVDIANERKRVLRGNGRYDLLRIENLSKIYKTKKLGKLLAVDRICLGVPKGECFGLLGVNGAGKTTTFKMLTGDLRPTSGDAFLNRSSIRKNLLAVQKQIGYCPQFDALFDELTGREHLQLYSRLKGIPPKEEKRVVDWALEKLCLQQYADKPSGTYSGGNKRKLSTAIALIGQPSVIFMDEPTTGMDPHSRRFLWDLILNLVKDGRSIIFTSHSMEECEALCSRLAIMVNGKFKCLGSKQHLKNKFGDGYTFSLRLKGPNFEHSSTSVQRFIERKFPEAVIKEHHYNLLQYELRGPSVCLSSLFNSMEEAQRDLDVEDYSVSQNTLDNVFINFVKQQAEIVAESDQLQKEANKTEDEHMISLEGYENDGLGMDNDDDDNVTFSLNGQTHLSLLDIDC